MQGFSTEDYDCVYVDSSDSNIPIHWDDYRREMMEVVLKKEVSEWGN